MPTMSEIVAEHTELAESEYGVAQAAGLRLAADRRPVLLRPRALGPRPRRERLLGSCPDPADHRADLPGRRRGRRPDRLCTRAPGLRCLRERQDHPDQRGQAPGRHPGCGARRPGALSRPGDRGPGAAHQPTRGADAEPAGEGISGNRRPAGRDDHDGAVPGAVRRDQPDARTAGRRRLHPAGRRRRRRLRQSERAQRVPADRADRRSRRRAPGIAVGRSDPALGRTGGRLRAVGAVRPRRAPSRAGLGRGAHDAPNPAAPQGLAAGRRDRALPRRQRSPDPRARAGHQGRHHP